MFKSIQKNNDAYKKANLVNMIEKLTSKGYVICKLNDKGILIKKGFENGK